MSGSQTIKTQCSHPGLWIEDVTIYEDIRDKRILRRVPLKRGLNIIWGDAGEIPDDEVAPGTLSGHSVGKTTLCRLIRYILGESSFGRKGTCRGIKHALPNAVVAATVHVGDTQWAVIRPIGVLKTSCAATGITVHDLLDQKFEDYPYSHFLKILGDSFLAKLPGYPELPEAKKYRWEHLLAWMTRDQEARYQSLWEWRSPRSESNVASLKKAEAMPLMRMVFDLYSAEEEELTQKIERLKDEYKAASDRLAKQHQDIQSRMRRELDAFKEILTDAGELQPDDGGLFGYDHQADYYKSKLRQQMGVLERHRENIIDEIAARRGERQRYEISLNRLTAGIAEVTEAKTTDDGIEKELQDVESAAIDDCVYGGRPFAQCEYFLDNRQRLRKEYHDYLVQQQSSEAGTQPDRTKDIREWTAERTGIERSIKSLSDQIERLEKSDREIRQQIAEIQSTIQRIEYHQRACEKLGILANNEELATAQHEARDLSAELRELERRLQTIRGALELKRGAVDGIYKDTIHRILSTRYSGEVKMNRDGDIDFTIGEGVGLSGEAVETLALVLADITAMRWAMESTGYHPRFLVHDSPREADLDRGIYNGYLSSMRNLAVEAGDENAPFQYIITTTSRPPKRLIEDGTVRLTLQSLPVEHLLFGRLINNAPGLFPDEDGE